MEIDLCTPQRVLLVTSSTPTSVVSSDQTVLTSSLKSNCTINQNDRLNIADGLPGDSLSPRYTLANVQSPTLPIGLSSALFKPLIVAVFNPKRLSKQTILSCDLERLCIALLQASRVNVQPFPLVGYQLYGLTILLSQKIKLLASDVISFSRRVLTNVTCFQQSRCRNSINYRQDVDDNEDVPVQPKRRRRVKKRKALVSDSIASLPKLDDYFEKTQDFLLPIERMEVMQMMNLGIGMGLSTELDIYNAQHHRDMSKLAIEQYKPDVESVISSAYNSGMISFDDLHFLSTPFKLNAYSFSPDIGLYSNGLESEMRCGYDYDIATTVANSEITFNSDDITSFTPELDNRYDMDWNIYNDPSSADLIEDYFANEQVIPQENKRRLALVDKTNGKVVHLILNKSTKRFDDKLTTTAHLKTPKRACRTSRSTQMDIHTAFAISTCRINQPDATTTCQKTLELNKAFDSVYKSYLEQSPIAINDEYKTPRETVSNIENLTANEEYHSTEQILEWDANVYTNSLNIKDGLVKNNVNYKKTKQWDESWSERPSTCSVLNMYRNAISRHRKYVDFYEIATHKDRQTVALIFYKSLILANAQFISIEENSKAQIIICPKHRFWEPIKGTPLINTNR